MEQLNRIAAVYFLSPLWRLVLHLTEGQVLPSTTPFVEDETWEKAKNAPVLKNHLEVVQTAAFLYYGQYEAGADLSIRRGDEYLQKNPAMPLGIWDMFFKGMCMFAAARIQGKRKYKRHGDVIRSKIHSWVRKGNPNSQHHAVILDAEFYAVNSQWAKARKSYEEGIVIASRAGFIHDAALANERYAMLLVEQKGDNSTIEDAKFRLQEAIRLYTEWGASTKVTLLEITYAKVLGTPD
jgi:hypothetical protein